MKITSQEEYGLRILLRIAKDSSGKGLTISGISQEEGMSKHHVAKICRVLRLNDLIQSTRGQTGGYSLSRIPKDIHLSEVLDVLGGRLFDDDFCGNHAGMGKLCTNSIDCSIRSLWSVIQYSVDSVMNNLTLDDLIGNDLKEHLGEALREKSLN